MNKPFIGIAAILALLATPALGADMPLKAPPPPPPPPTWTGCYLGGNAGGAWSATHDTWTNIVEGAGGFAAGAATVLPAAANATINSSGFIGGGQFGCNNQTGQFVLGLEADLDWDSLKTTRAATSAAGAAIVPGAITESVQNNWLSTFRARAGVANGAWLFYVTGGGAIADARTFDQVCFPTAVVPACVTGSSTNAVGWTAGAGIEWMFAPSWSVKVEYLYVDLPRTTETSTAPAAFPLATFTPNHTFTENIARLGINYHFNMAGIP
jgi:outer membrane immunogenic protein